MVSLIHKEVREVLCERELHLFGELPCDLGSGNNHIALLDECSGGGLVSEVVFQDSHNRVHGLISNRPKHLQQTKIRKFLGNLRAEGICEQSPAPCGIGKTPSPKAWFQSSLYQWAWQG